MCAQYARARLHILVVARCSRCGICWAWRKLVRPARVLGVVGTSRVHFTRVYIVIHLSVQQVSKTDTYRYAACAPRALLEGVWHDARAPPAPARRHALVGLPSLCFPDGGHLNTVRARKATEDDLRGHHCLQSGFAPATFLEDDVRWSLARVEKVCPDTRVLAAPFVLDR